MNRKNGEEVRNRNLEAITGFSPSSQKPGEGDSEAAVHAYLDDALLELSYMYFSRRRRAQDWEQNTETSLMNLCGLGPNLFSSSCF